MTIAMIALGFSTGELFEEIMFPICCLLIGLETSFGKEIF